MKKLLALAVTGGALTLAACGGQAATNSSAPASSAPASFVQDTRSETPQATRDGDHDGHPCPDKGGAGGGSSATPAPQGQSTTPAPSASPDV